MFGIVFEKSQFGTTAADVWELIVLNSLGYANTLRPV